MIISSIPKFVSAQLACALLVGLSTACASSELAVASSHPGNPEAFPGKLPVVSSLRSDWGAASTPVPSESKEHDAHAHDAHAHDAHAQSEAASDSSEAGATRFTCSMHPEVVSDKPGKCPKCGMNLIPKKEEK